MALAAINHGGNISFHGSSPLSVKMDINSPLVVNESKHSNVIILSPSGQPPKTQHSNSL